MKKIQEQEDEYTVKELNPPRPDSKLLVLDIDFTIYDPRSRAAARRQRDRQPFNLLKSEVYYRMRPYLHEFLAQSYEEK